MEVLETGMCTNKAEREMQISVNRYKVLEDGRRKASVNFDWVFHQEFSLPRLV